MVILGAVSVVENGGIINKIGSYGISLIAKAYNKPVYVLTESTKFTREYPINQSDLKKLVPREHMEFNNLTVDYTPPELISLLFTDLGIFTPAAVSDELI